jgi:OFA family oxalate/formate antiporter-like MFS transporter
MQRLRPVPSSGLNPVKKGLIAGIVVAGIGLSAIYIAPLTNYLLRTSGVQHTFLILGILALVSLVVFSLLLKNPPAGYVPQTKKDRPAVAHGHDYSWQEMIKTRPFFLLWFTYLLSATAGLMLIGHIASIAWVQAGWQGGFVLVVILAIFNTSGRILGGFLSDIMGRTSALLLVFVIQALNMFAFSVLTSIPLLIVGTAVAGLAYGALFSLFPATTADFFGIKNLGVNYGLIFTGWGIAGIVGPVLAGQVADLTGTYTASYWAAGSMLVLGALLVGFIKAPKSKEV